MSRRFWIALAVVAAVVVVAGTYWWRGRDEAAETDDAQETHIVERGTMMDTVAGTGSLEPSESVDISFPSSGEVAEVLVELGDMVDEGQPIAVLDTTELAMDLDAAESDLAASQSNYASALSSHESLLAGPTDADIRAAELEVEQAKDSLWGRQASRDGICGRVEAGRGQQYECDSQEASVLQSEGSVRSAELRHDQVVAGASDDEIAASKAKLASAESQLLGARNKVEQAQLRLQQATLTSPISGTVTLLSLVAGQTAGSSAPAATVADLGSLNVVIQLDETDVASVHEGMHATVTLDAFPDDPFDGEVVTIAPVGESQSGVVLFPVTVAVQPNDVPARPGMTAEVDIVTQFVEDTLVVPLRAVNSTPRGSFVLRVAGAGEAVESGADADGAFGQRRMAREGSAGEGERRFPRDMSGDGSFQPPEGMSEAMANENSVLQQLADAGGVPTFVEVGMTTATEAEILSGIEEGDVVLVPSSSITNDMMRFGGPGMGMGVLRGRP